MERRLRFSGRAECRKWLEDNYRQDEPVWIEYYKDGRKGISYQESLEEALCFGWIDSLIRKIDEAVYVRKFSKRKKNSRWSENNKKLVLKLVKKGVVAQPGMDSIEEAKRNEMWKRKDEREDLADIEGLRKILKKKMSHIKEFDGLSESLRKHYSIVYYSAKTEKTRMKRFDIIIEYMKTKRRFM